MDVHARTNEYGNRTSPRDRSNKSHTIKEIIVEFPQEPEKKYYSSTPRTRGDGAGDFYGNDYRRQQKMEDPPGYNQNGGVVSKQRSREPETAAEFHRRRKRAIEKQRAIEERGLKRFFGDSLDNTANTESMNSDYSSWVPNRSYDKDPNNKPVRHSEAEQRARRQMKKVRMKYSPWKELFPKPILSTHHHQLSILNSLTLSDLLIGI